MKKASRETLPEYNLRAGVRGKHAERYREVGNVVLLDARAAEDAEIWAPLMSFVWDGAQFCIAADTWLRPAKDYEGFNQYAYVLAPEELDRCREALHWLHISRKGGEGLSAGEKINSFLMALWIARPTATHVPFRFEETPSGTKPFARHLDRFQWIRGQVREHVRDEHLSKARDLLPGLRRAYARRKRLRNALILTHRGCVSTSWQVAFVCWSAAAEALLTYSRGPGVTGRLARSYATLVTVSQAGAKRAEELFAKSYSIRSDIVHGYAHDRSGSVRNLRDLATFSNILRRLWSVVLTNPDLSEILEGGDDVRRKHLLGS